MHGLNIVGAGAPAHGRSGRGCL